MVTPTAAASVAPRIPSTNTIRPIHSTRNVRALATQTGTTLVNETFTANATAPSLWTGFGDACLTAGSSATPATSLAACGATAPQDTAGQGALQLTAGSGNRIGMVIDKTALSTASGLQITFTDYAFHGSAPGADGIAFFLTDASKPFPTHVGQPGAGLAYAGSSTTGLPNGYVGVGLDEYGNFSNVTGGPGRIAETIAVRGSATTAYQYIGGAKNSAGNAASLPFSFDQPTLTTRPANAPTISATLTAAGALSVAIDRHDGNGFVAYYAQSIVGTGGQPAVPAQVYFGVGASTGGSYNVHQISGLTVSTLSAAPPPPPPPPPPLTSINEPFTTAATTASLWSGFGDACLTAGSAAATPATSLPACGATASADAAGQGALQLTAGTTNRNGMVIEKTPLATADGLQITFTDYAFHGTSPGADGIAFFLTD